jgi:hypothetical protein
MVWKDSDWVNSGLEEGLVIGCLKQSKQLFRRLAKNSAVDEAVSCAEGGQCCNSQFPIHSFSLYSYAILEQNINDGPQAAV